LKPVKILHTSDWHLGHELAGHSREAEHDAFLAWLLDVTEEHSCDVLLVTGDLYDMANPPVSAQQRLYTFIANARNRLPHLQIIMIGGNHDSALRIDLPGALVDERVYLVGGLPKKNRQPDFERICIPLENSDGQVAAWLGAVPFCRPGDLGKESLEELYAETTRQLLARANGLPIVLTGHLHVAGGDVSDLSERRIVIGGEEAHAASLFSTDVTYGALGHLHRPQRITGPSLIRYAGSPFPLSVTERNYRHSVTLVTLTAGEPVAEELLIPRTVPFLRVPNGGPRSLDDVVKELEALPVETLPRDQQPFLEVSVLMETAEPHLQARILNALEGKSVRLTRINRVVQQGGHLGSLADQRQELADLHPEKVFAALHERRYAKTPDTALERAFAELLLLAETADPTLSKAD